VYPDSTNGCQAAIYGGLALPDKHHPGRVPARVMFTGVLLDADFPHAGFLQRGDTLFGEVGFILYEALHDSAVTR